MDRNPFLDRAVGTSKPSDFHFARLTHIKKSSYVLR
jgi:hypothetical protein